MILIVEDNPRSARVLRLALEAYPHVEWVDNPGAAYRYLSDHGSELELIIVDRHLSRIEGLLDGAGEELLRFSLDHYPEVRRIMITAEPRAGDVDEYKREFGLSALLVKTSQSFGAPGIQRAAERALLESHSEPAPAGAQTSVTVLQNAIERIRGQMSTRKVGLEREIRSTSRTKPSGWKATNEAVSEHVRQLSASIVEFDLAAIRAEKELQSLQGDAANQYVLDFTSHWDSRVT